MEKDDEDEDFLDDEDILSDEDEDEIKERLKKLGYL